MVILSAWLKLSGIPCNDINYSASFFTSALDHLFFCLFVGR